MKLAIASGKGGIVNWWLGTKPARRGKAAQAAAIFAAAGDLRNNGRFSA